MKRYWYIPLIVFSYILVGCSSNDPQPNMTTESKTLASKQTVNEVAEDVNKIKESTSLSWIDNPNREGYICEVGFAKINGDEDLTKKIAKIEAKAGISQTIESYIKTQSTLEASCNNDECKNKFSSKTHISSTQMIKNIEIVNQYTDVDKGIYYIHLCSKI